VRNWYGITYPSKLLCHKSILKFWKKYFCVRGWHLFDEMDSQGCHSLICDACELDIEIKMVRKWNEETKENQFLGE